MKTKLPVIAVAVFLVSSCAMGPNMTRTNDDGIYFSPTDNPPVSVVENTTQVKEQPAKNTNSDSQNQKVIISKTVKNADGSNSVNNFVLQPDQNNPNSDTQAYELNDQDLAQSDTTFYYNDDDVKYVINNYYDDNDLEYANRFNRFYGPYYSSFYDPFFFDDWYYGYGGYGGYWGYPYFTLDLVETGVILIMVILTPVITEVGILVVDIMVVPFWVVVTITTRLQEEEQPI